MRSRATQSGVALSVLFDVISKLREGEGSHLPTYAEHVMVLLATQPDGRLSFAELRKKLGIHQPRLSRLLVALEGMEWIATAESPDDNRKSLVRITPKGRRVIDAITKIAMTSEK